MEVKSYSNRTMDESGFKKSFTDWQESAQKLIEGFKQMSVTQQQDDDNNYTDPIISEKKKQVKMMIELAGCMVARMYTRKSWCNLADAIVKAVSIARRPKATDSDLNEAIKILSAGLSKLQLADKNDEEKKRGQVADFLEANNKAIIKEMESAVQVSFSDVSVMTGSATVQISAPVSISAIDINV